MCEVLRYVGQHARSSHDLRVCKRRRWMARCPSATLAMVSAASKTKFNAKRAPSSLQLRTQRCHGARCHQLVSARRYCPGKVVQHSMIETERSRPGSTGKAGTLPAYLPTSSSAVHTPPPGCAGDLQSSGKPTEQTPWRLRSPIRDC